MQQKISKLHGPDSKALYLVVHQVFSKDQRASNAVVDLLDRGIEKRADQRNGSHKNFLRQFCAQQVLNPTEISGFYFVRDDPKHAHFLFNEGVIGQVKIRYELVVTLSFSGTHQDDRNSQVLCYYGIQVKPVPSRRMKSKRSSSSLYFLKMMSTISSSWLLIFIPITS